MRSIKSRNSNRSSRKQSYQIALKKEDDDEDEENNNNNDE